MKLKTIIFSLLLILTGKEVYDRLQTQNPTVCNLYTITNTLDWTKSMIDMTNYLSNKKSVTILLSNFSLNKSEKEKIIKTNNLIRDGSSYKCGDLKVFIEPLNIHLHQIPDSYYNSILLNKRHFIVPKDKIDCFKVKN